MTDEDVKVMMLMQKRLYTLSVDAADRALKVAGKEPQAFLEKVAMEARKLYFDASDLLVGRTWPSKERRRIHA